MPVTVLRQPGAAWARLADLYAEVSYDDGLTWQPVPVTRTGDDALLRLTHPAAVGYVSLRALAGDSAGNTVEQTNIRAYRLGAVARGAEAVYARG